MDGPTFDIDVGALGVLTRDRDARVILFRLSNAQTSHVTERLNAVLTGSTDVRDQPAIVLIEEAASTISPLRASGR